MVDNTNRTVLITGASSGLGFEAAAQFAEAGYSRVIATARTQAKVDRTIGELEARTGADVFDGLALDLDELSSAEAAAAALIESGQTIDVLILNAGLPGSDGHKTTDGIEAIVAASLTGHHLLTMRLLDARLLGSDARVVIAGSEAARGDVPMFSPTDIARLATDDFEGDLGAAIEAVVRGDAPAKFNSNNQYATAKVFVAWWAAELANKLPAGMTVNAVSPGSTPGTNAGDKLPAWMRRIMIPLTNIVPGMSHSVADGAGRYVQAVFYDSSKTGMFFASKPQRMTGPLHRIEMPHIDNKDAQRALWDVTEAITKRVAETPQ